jgi:ATP-binding cassette subfamily B protein
MFLDRNRMLLERETSKADDLSRTLSKFGGYFRSYWLGLVVTLVFVMVSVAVQIIGPNLIGQAVDCYLFPQDPSACWYTTVDAARSSSDTLAGLGGLVLLLLLAYVVDALAVGTAFYTMRWTGQKVLYKLRKDLFEHLHRLSVGYYARSDAGGVMSRVTNDMETVQQMFNFALLNVIRGVLTIVFIIGAMLTANLSYALISLIIIPIMLATTMYFSTQARKAFRRARTEIGNVNADLQENISGAREVQAFNREEESIADFQRSNEANRQANIRAAVFTSALNPILESLSYLALGVVVLFGGISALRGHALLGGSVISLGMIFTFVNYLQRLNNPVQQIAVLWTNVQSGFAGAERIFDLMEEQPDIVDKPDAIDLPPIKGEIKFENVWAEYIIGEPVLKGVDFTAEPGQMIAIVGATGAGKTTMINMIPRFYDVTGGAVKIDGYDVRDVKMDSLRSQIGVVLQDTFLFSDTVMNNIRYSKPEATDQEVIDAATMAAAHDFILRLPDKYDTVLGERGSGLSQGQRQLIAIARVALMNPHILILDEATSSVDTRTERMIQQAFEKLLEGRTSFVIAHRLSTIRNADLVMMVSDGEIIERGTHRDLLEKGGPYKDLYMSQFREEEEESATPEPASD